MEWMQFYVGIRYNWTCSFLSIWCGKWGGSAFFKLSTNREHQCDISRAVAWGHRRDISCPGFIQQHYTIINLTFSIRIYLIYKKMCAFFFCLFFPRRRQKVIAINLRRYLLVGFLTTAGNLNSGIILTDLVWWVVYCFLSCHAQNRKW